MSHPPNLFGLFQKRIPGDDALLWLARRRFDQAGLNPEIYAGDRSELRQALAFKPPHASEAVVHLPRSLNPLYQESVDRILEIAGTDPTQCQRFVLHDQWEAHSSIDSYVEALTALGDHLAEVSPSLTLYVEYAVGLPLDAFIALFQRLRSTPNVTVCVDIGHVAIAQCRQAFAKAYPDIDIGDFNPNSNELRDYLPDILAAAETALPTVIQLVKELAAFGKPIHFHLHDAHPIDKSQYGVSDHKSFLAPIPIPFAYNGRSALPTIYGPHGLTRIVQTAIASLDKHRLSFTLELHETPDRLSISDGEHLFAHWADKHHAEQMNHWLSLLQTNHRLLEAALKVEAAASR